MARKKTTGEEQTGQMQRLMRLYPSAGPELHKLIVANTPASMLPKEQWPDTPESLAARKQEREIKKQ